MKIQTNLIKTPLLVLLAIVLAAATIVERYKGPDFTATHFYGSWWFALLLGLLAVAFVWVIIKDRMWRRPALLLTHVAVPVILLGGALTSWVGKSGEMTLHPSEPCNTVENEDGSQWHVPFSLTLNNFEVVPYPGTHTPMDFISHLTIDGQSEIISMNNIYRRNGYRFYQADYDDDGTSVLSVAHDPWGIAVTYCGYALLLVGLLWLMLDGRGRFRSLLRGTAVLAIMLLPLASRAATPPPTLPRESADRMGQMMMLYKGRVCPVQTFAKDFTTKLTGSATYRGLTPEQVLSGWLFYFDQWQNEPAIKVKGGQWQDEYQFDGRHLSFADLAVLEGSQAGPTADKKLRAAIEKQSLVRSLMRGKLLRIFPISDSAGTLNWYAQNDDLPLALSDDTYLFVRKYQSYCQELVVAQDFEALNHVFDKIIEFQHKNAATVLPSTSRQHAERLYNSLTTGRWLAMLSVTLGLLLFAAAVVGRRWSEQAKRALRCVGLVFVALLTLWLLAIIVLRWVAGGHAPMAGGFDSMNLMGLVIGIITLALNRRSPFVVPGGTMAIGFSQLVAMMSGSNPPVTNLMPVLNSPLLTLHVTVIMIAYALLFFVMMGGVAGLAVQRHPEVSAQQQRTDLLLLFPAVFLLALGIIIGAVWANLSWGTYWSWDPKEVWALITFIVYAIPLGAKMSVRGFHLYSVLAFASVLVTYFGVNLLLGGMHSYN
ncbi:MAG: cytochrome c biogenesis protein CcsA [Bacteroidales bacterium]|nr:cytochrome c biogenesis protein CcsA [Bacteroidales bacterium]